MNELVAVGMMIFLCGAGLTVLYWFFWVAPDMDRQPRRREGRDRREFLREFGPRDGEQPEYVRRMAHGPCGPLCAPSRNGEMLTSIRADRMGQEAFHQEHRASYHEQLLAQAEQDAQAYLHGTDWARIEAPEPEYDTRSWEQQQHDAELDYYAQHGGGNYYQRGLEAAQHDYEYGLLPDGARVPDGVEPRGLPAGDDYVEGEWWERSDDRDPYYLGRG